MKINILIFSLIVLPIIVLGQVTSQQTSFTYKMASCVGTKNSTAWIGQNVVVMIEGETPSDRDPAIMTTVVQTFDNIISKFEEITGLNNLPHNSSFNNKPVIEIVIDNCGAGGLAGHGAVGMSTGKYFFNRFYNFVQQGSIRVPQVFFYELNRNFWLNGANGFNNKIDWAMNNSASNYGWWTVGMNNAQAYIMPKLLNIELDYFGQTLTNWETNMLNDFYPYLNNNTYNFDYGWRQDRMPWRNVQSINNLMSGFIIYSYNNFGGENWIKRFYQQLQNPNIPDRSGVFAYQECRDNIYRIWSAAAQQDLRSFFENDMRWTISQSCVGNNVSLTLTTDNYASETSWTLKNSSGATVQSGNGYNNNQTYTFNWNLPADSYTFIINDSYGDGICCAYGNGSYTLTAGSTTIKSGGSFTNSETTDFCTAGTPCPTINLSSLSLKSYGGSQDVGTGSINGNTITIANNAWKYIDYNYNVTANTIIEFEFYSTDEGEVQGLGFDNDNGLSGNYTFRLYGTQNWAISNYKNYNTPTKY